MNTLLPAGIESYLKEAGFSATEMLIIRKLVEDQALTLRELASKSGKSTGVLDQAMKKLLTKRIVEKKLINDQPKYSINSLEAIVKWVEADMKQRKEILDRKHRNFQEFISSLTIDKNRPDMEYFDGVSGLEQAYLRLLESGEELLTLMPAPAVDREDALREFKITYFRKRQYRKIFQRILMADTSLARRFQSRDVFEYRKTLLSSHDIGTTFEKTIAGDIVACIDHNNQSACFIRFPDLARAEKASFEALWTKQLFLEHASTALVIPSSTPVIPLTTKFFSGVREFVLGKSSLAAFAFFALISAGLTFGMYRDAQRLNFQRMRDKVSAIAATGVLNMNTDDLATLQVQDDWQKPEWTRVVGELAKIRSQNSDVLFAYIFRKSPEDPNALQFVADSHSLNPFANSDAISSNDIDVNQDGVIDDVDYLQWPGQPYPAPPADAFKAFDGMRANNDFYQDAWGKVVTGYAPIKDVGGNAIAVLAIDIQAEKLYELTSSSFYPLYWFALLFLLFVVARFFAYGWRPFTASGRTSSLPS